MKLTKEGDNRYRGQDGILYNREGEVIDANQSPPEASSSTHEGQREGQPGSEQEEG